MSIFSKKNELAEVMKQGELSLQEKIRRKEFCVQQATFVCDERPADVLRVAEDIYEWLYEEKP